MFQSARELQWLSHLKENKQQKTTNRMSLTWNVCNDSGQKIIKKTVYSHDDVTASSYVLHPDLSVHDVLHNGLIDLVNDRDGSGSMGLLAYALGEQPHLKYIFFIFKLESNFRKKKNLLVLIHLWVEFGIMCCNLYY